jgi:membrane fusion protein (multidrug efflux system)
MTSNFFAGSILSRRQRAGSAAVLALGLISACSDGEAPANGMRGPGGGAPTPVITASAEQRSFAESLEAVGTALAKESIEVTSKTSNTVTVIRFIEGQQVRAGTILVELDQAQARAALIEAEANLLESRNQLNRGRDLSVTQALSQAQLDQLETAVKTAEARVSAARARLEDLVIRAPFAGVTGFRRVSLGGLVNPGSIITTLDDISSIKLEFTVPQSFLKNLRPGLQVTATADGLGGQEFLGTVTAIDSRIDPVSRAVAVRAELPNESNVLRPGLFMSVRLQAAAQPSIVVPESALMPIEGKTFVFVVKDGNAERREVQTGGREPGLVVITRGVQAGEQVIVEGMQRVREGAPVQAESRS